MLIKVSFSRIVYTQGPSVGVGVCVSVGKDVSVAVGVGVGRLSVGWGVGDKVADGVIVSVTVNVTCGNGLIGSCITAGAVGVVSSFAPHAAKDNARKMINISVTFLDFIIRFIR